MRFDLRLSRRPLVSILIVVLESDTRLRLCLKALQRNLPQDIATEIVVVLCRFSSKAVARLRAAAPNVRVFWSEANLGMAGGMNLARSLARGKYLVVLHDDAVIKPGWLQVLVATAEAHPFAGAVGSMAVRPDRFVQYAGALLWSNGYTSSTFHGGPRPRPAEVTEPIPVDYSGTASLLVRADAFDAIGGCDETFYPAYYVDVNIALGLRQVGRYVMVAPGSRVIHLGGGSTTPRYRQFMFERNHARMLAKWAGVLPEYGDFPSADAQGALAGALARVAAFAARCRELAMPLPAQRPCPFDIAGQQRRHIEMEAALRRDYVAMLEGRLDERKGRSVPSGPRAVRRRHRGLPVGGGGRSVAPGIRGDQW